MTNTQPNNPDSNSGDGIDEWQQASQFVKHLFREHVVMTDGSSFNKTQIQKEITEYAAKAVKKAALEARIHQTKRTKRRATGTNHKWIRGYLEAEVERLKAQRSDLDG